MADTAGGSRLGEPARGWGAIMRTRIPEPTSSVPLRWGTYRGRYGNGLAMLVTGGVLIELTNTYFLFGLLAGTMLHTSGWLILPAQGWRRVVPALPSTLAFCGMLGGPAQMWLFVVPLAGWLLVRHRPARCWPVLLIPIAFGLLLAELLHDYGAFGLALTASTVLLVATAWLARRLHLGRTLRANAKGSGGLIG
ncbi:hypothetical protein [Planctomonas psychrotolerans]|uniref:hypothetical protein n=1 Tax=Planctomonas psychrotolerans TaxID=2528712 RepID=UPI00123A2B8C|nr:hypothetical protein [Planctomonas psychrotolerans]